MAGEHSWGAPVASETPKVGSWGPWDKPEGAGWRDFLLLPLFSSITACFSYGMRVLLKIFV